MVWRCRKNSATCAAFDVHSETDVLADGWHVQARCVMDIKVDFGHVDNCMVMVAVVYMRCRPDFER